MERPTMISAPLADIRRRLAGLLEDRRGVSAVEFAMLLPLLVTLYFGTVEISQGLSIDRKVTLAARIAADLVTQATAVDNTAIAGIFEASKSVVMPYPTANLSVTITAVNIDGQGKPTVAWSETLNGTKRSGSVTLPTGLVVNNTQLIWSEVSYTYKPTIGYVVTGTIPLKDQIYMRPRLSDAVTKL
jgi:Flp pilus assembly protein TadG